MLRKHISIVVSFIVAAGIAVCAPDLAIAQGASTLLPSDGGGGGAPPPPATNGNGSLEQPRMPSPSQESMSPRSGEFRRQEMPGRPMDGGINRPAGDANQEGYTRSQQDGEFHPQGQPFMGDGRDNAQGRPFMGGNPPEGRPFGGSEFGGGGEDQEGMERRTQEREKMMEQEQLRQMKRGMTGMERGLRQIRKMMESLPKKGIAVPVDAQALVQELQTALDTVKNASEFNEEVQGAIEVIQDKGPDLGELGQKIGMLERLSQMTKQVGKEFAKIDTMVAKVKKSKAGREFADALARVEGEVGALKAEWERTKSAIASGEEDGDDLRNTMDGFFERVGDIHRNLELVRQLGSISTMIKSADKEITMAEKEIARQRKAGKDVAKLEELLAAAKAKIAEVKALTAEPGFNPNDLFSLMQELRQIGDDARDELDRVSGRAEVNALGASVIQALTLRRLGF